MFLLGRTQEFLNVVVQDIFGGLDMDDKMELVKRWENQSMIQKFQVFCTSCKTHEFILICRYSKSPEDKENLENEYGAAYIEYFVNR